MRDGCAECARSRDVIARLRAQLAELRGALRDRHVRDQLIVGRYQCGESSRAIARDFGLTKQGVHHVLTRRGVPLRPPGRQGLA